MKKIFLFIAILMGLSSVPLLAQGANMSKYISISVMNGQAIKLDLKAKNANTPIRIVSGNTTKDITVGTDWYNGKYPSEFTVTANSTNMTIYGDVAEFDCSNNGNNLYGIESSKNADLSLLYCSNNELTTLDVSKNYLLTFLNCSNNKISSLNLNSNTLLNELICYNNLFSTEAVNALYCSLPTRQSQNPGKCFILNTTTDANHAAVVQATSNNARNKNWQVKYNNNFVEPQNDVPNNGSFVCSQAQTPDMSKYITLTVARGQSIKMNFKAAEENTPIRIESAGNTQDIIIGTNWYQSYNQSDFTFTSNVNTITIYGNITGFNCSNNEANLTYVDVAYAPQLKELDCNNNHLTYIDLSTLSELHTVNCSNNKLNALNLNSNTQLKTVLCYNNRFNTQAINSLYCSLPTVTGEASKIFPINTLADANIMQVQAATSNIARNKNWQVRLYNNGNVAQQSDIQSNGNYSCVPANLPNMNKYITLNVENGNDIKLNLKAKADNTPIRIVSGSNTVDIIVDNAWYENIKTNVFSVPADGSTMTIYGDLIGFICADNEYRVTAIDLTKNTNLEELDCSNNQIASLDLTDNFKLRDVKCHNNAFTTDAINNLYCSIPSYGSGTIYTLNAKNDASHAAVIAATSDNARAKNWEVKYFNNGNAPQRDVLSTGTHKCTNPKSPNVNRYISLEVANNQAIKLNFKAKANNTTVRLVSGSKSQDIYIDTTWYNTDAQNNFTFMPEDNTITIYGEVSDFICSNNGANLTKLDVSNNSELRFLNCNDNNLYSLNTSNNSKLMSLNCSNNQLTSLDLSANTALTNVRCYNNPFTTDAVNRLYCSLPKSEANDKAKIFTLNTTADNNHKYVTDADSRNATAKKWTVAYYNNNSNNITEVPFTNGVSYSCSAIRTPNMSKHISLTVQDGQDIRMSFKSAVVKTPILVVSGKNKIKLTIDTSWYGHYNSTTFSIKANGNIVKVYGDIVAFDCSNNMRALSKVDISNNKSLAQLNCSNNQIANIDVSDNVKLENLNCEGNQIRSIDLSKNYLLKYLYCGNNQISELNLRKNVDLAYLYCGNNELTALDLENNSLLNLLSCENNQIKAIDLSNNTNLTYLDCNNNQITTLDLSRNILLNTVKFYNNPFNTDAVNRLYCSLPKLTNKAIGKCYPLNTTADANNLVVELATSKNARDKKWDVQYFNNSNLPQNDIKNNGNFSCASIPVPNMGKFIELTVKSGEDIKMNFKAAANNTPIRIVSRSNIKELTIDSEWYNTTNKQDFFITADGSMVRIYGDITEFVCANNKANLTAIDIKNNKSLTSLDCSDNSLRYLDLSDNAKLTEVSCYDNLFTTKEVNKLYCSLNALPAVEKGKLYVLKSEKDTFHGSIVAATSNIAKTKNWEVKYKETGAEVPSNGNYACVPAPNLDRFITLNVEKGRELKMNFIAVEDSTLVRVVNGEETKVITADAQWNKDEFAFKTLANTITFYGDIEHIDCSNNAGVLTGIDASNNLDLKGIIITDNDLETLDISKNPALKSLDCSDNKLKTIDLSKNTGLEEFNCANNKIANIDLSKNTALIKLDCSYNMLTALDVNANVNLVKIECFQNPMNTEAIDLFYCSLPTATDSNAVCYILDTREDGNHKSAVNSTASTARDKNWKVQYKSLGKDVPTFGKFICPGEPNKFSFITLTVNMESDVKLNFQAANDSTVIRIISGEMKQDVIANKDWFRGNNGEISDIMIHAVDTNVTIYGDITVFDCSMNSTAGLKGIDASNNPGLTELICKQNLLTSLNLRNNSELRVLDCSNNDLTTIDLSRNSKLNRLTSDRNNINSINLSNNQELTHLWISANNLNSIDLSKNTKLEELNIINNRLTALDLSNNTNLKTVLCYYNDFDTEATNQLYCSLPVVNKDTVGYCYTLNRESDDNHDYVIEATSDNARAKNWKVLYYNDDREEKENIPSNGNFDCVSGIDESQISGISVFPNPAETKVQIQLDENVNETLIVVDLSGRAVLTENLVSGKATIDVSNLTAGTYFIKVGNRVQKLTVK